MRDYFREQAKIQRIKRSGLKKNDKLDFPMTKKDIGKEEFRKLLLALKKKKNGKH